MKSDVICILCMETGDKCLAPVLHLLHKRRDLGMRRTAGSSNGWPRPTP